MTTGATTASDKIWVNSGDSHVWEPKTLWTENLPPSLKARGPHMVRDGKHDIYVVDDQGDIVSESTRYIVPISL